MSRKEGLLVLRALFIFIFAVQFLLIVQACLSTPQLLWVYSSNLNTRNYFAKACFGNMYSLLILKTVPVVDFEVKLRTLRLVCFLTFLWKLSMTWLSSGSVVQSLSSFYQCSSYSCTYLASEVDWNPAWLKMSPNCIYDWFPGSEKGIPFFFFGVCHFTATSSDAVHWLTR